MVLFRQRWRDVLFLHWPMAAEHVRPLIPAPLELDTFAGAAWVGAIAFSAPATQPLGFFPLGPAGRCLQVNLQTYVRHGDTAGSWFFSLDADNAALVLAARAALHFPYRFAKGNVKRSADRCEVRLQRRRGFADFWAAWRVAEAFEAGAGTLDRFLTDRYWLFGARRRILFRQRLAHVPWALHRVELIVHRVSLAESAGLPHLEGAPLAHASPGADVDLFAPEPLALRRLAEPIGAPGSPRMFERERAHAPR